MASEKRLIDLLRVDLCEVDISDCTDVEDILSEIITYLYEQPEVDAVEVVHGRWRWCGSDRWNDAYQCSNCGKIAMNDSNYCPNCGAKMDGGVYQ